MRAAIYDRCLRRELSGIYPRYSSSRGLYGDRDCARDLDVVNELGGHSGCVNALRSVLTMPNFRYLVDHL